MDALYFAVWGLIMTALITAGFHVSGSTLHTRANKALDISLLAVAALFASVVAFTLINNSEAPSRGQVKSEVTSVAHSANTLKVPATRGKALADSREARHLANDQSSNYISTSPAASTNSAYRFNVSIYDSSAKACLTFSKETGRWTVSQTACPR
jgi:hypothetical protein